ncbi:hypothetical protein E3P77_00076 [Wallemia ichthyophaga]|nr:hypothetical protein E3P98_00223 [Wallemia ichthyophaga]TIB70035.1 hypothetical protein E3P77_00076 [Wallemia ichthyophaga]
MDEAQKPFRPARSQRRTRQQTEAPTSSSTRLDNVDDGTSGEINELLKHVRNEWAYVMEPDFNPVTLALNLLDDSQSSALHSFLDTKHNLEEALQSILNSHSHAFDATRAAHDQFNNSLQSTSTDIHDSRYALKDARDGLDIRRHDLRFLWSKGDSLKEAMHTLDLIEAVRSVPDMLESLITDKRWIEAVVLLNKSLTIVNLPSLTDVGAIVDLRLFLLSQDNALRELLIEELHNHVYLKTYHTDNLWRAYKPELNLESHDDDQERSFSNYLSNFSKCTLRDWRRMADTDTPTPTKQTIPSPNPNNVNTPSSPAVDLSVSVDNPIPTAAESDSYVYIQTILEALHVLQRVPDVLDLIPARLPLEIQAVISDTVDEVSHRSERLRAHTHTHSHTPSTQSAVTAGIISSLFRTSDTENAHKARELDLGAHILRDLLHTLFSKLEAVLRGLRVVGVVAHRLHGATLSLEEIWMLVQREAATLIESYLITDDDVDNASGGGGGVNSSSSGGGGATSLVASINDVLRHSGVARDRSKFLFRFAETDGKAMARSLKSHEEALSNVLASTMPGLVGSGSLYTNLIDTNAAMRSEFDRSYTRLTKSDAFNIPILFQPACAFVERAVHILGLHNDNNGSTHTDNAHVHTHTHTHPNHSDLRSLLDTFIDKVFLPQLQDKVMELFQGAVASTDAFAEETDRIGDSPKPVVKSVFGLLDLISHLSEMLRSTPFHREAYSRLIITVIIQYYQRCSERFMDLVGRERDNSSNNSAERPHDPKLSARWAQRAELTACLTELLATSDSDTSRKNDLCAQESRVEMGINDANRVQYDDMMNSKKKLAGLGHLFSSLKWFIVKLSALKVASEQLLPDEDYTMAERAPHSSTDKADLPLTRDMILRFEALLQTYHQLIDMILFTMRLEVRVMVVYYFDAGLRNDGEHRNEHEHEHTNRPDEYILQINKQLVKVDDVASKTLTESEKRFLFDGVGMLMDKMLMSITRSIRYIDRHGAARMIRNIGSLQQNLKTIITWPVGIDFGASRKFWEMFMISPSEWLGEIRRSGKMDFSFDEYESLLKLQCGEENGDGVELDNKNDRSRREYNDYHIELHQLMMDDDM